MRRFFKRKEKQTLEAKPKKTKVRTVSTRKKTVDYYTWQNKKDSIEQRAEKINDYLTEDLQTLNSDTVRDDIPTISSVSNIDIWSVTPDKHDTYAVVYSVDQNYGR
ncbi:MAG: hypothetical protein ACFWT6_03065 [Virgibacillus proomii]|jgi:hypothetical protein